MKICENNIFYGLSSISCRHNITRRIKIIFYKIVLFFTLEYYFNTVNKILHYINKIERLFHYIYTSNI